MYSWVWWGTDLKPGDSVPVIVQCTSYYLTGWLIQVKTICSLWFRVTSLSPHTGMASKKPECTIECCFHLLPSARKVERSQEQVLYSYINNMGLFPINSFAVGVCCQHKWVLFMDECMNTWKSTHPPFWWTCKVLLPWVLFHETKVHVHTIEC